MRCGEDLRPCYHTARYGSYLPSAEVNQFFRGRFLLRWICRAAHVRENHMMVVRDGKTRSKNIGVAGGDVRPKPQGGDRLSRRTEQHAGLIQAVLAEVPDLTLSELKARLAQEGAPVSVAALWRFCRRHKITRKKRPSTRLSRSVPTS